MRYYIIHQDKISSIVNSEKDARKDIMIIIKKNHYTESQALEYIEIVRGNTMHFRVVFTNPYIEIIK